MGGQQIQISGVSKIEGINYSLPIQEMFGQLSNSFKPEKIKLSNQALNTYGSLLFVIILGKIDDLDLHHLCKIFNVPNKLTKSEVFVDVSEKWFKNSVKIDFEGVLRRIEKVYSIADFDYTDKEYQRMRGSIKNLRILFQNNL